MVTTADICRCDTPLETAANGLTYCPHCDQGCTIQRDGGECIPCETFTANWKKRMKEYYTNG